MAYPARVTRALAHLASTDAPQSSHAPPLLRLLWRAGWSVPPPVLAGFWFNFLLMGGFFGVFWGIAMWVIQWRHGAPPGLMVAVSLATGAGFGLFMALYFRHVARKHRLPSWQSFDAQTP